MKKSNWSSVVSALSWLTQLGLSIAMPLLLCIGAAVWLQKHFGWAEWVVLVGILVGLVSAGCSFYEFCRMMKRQTKRRRDDEPHSFNK